MTEPNPGIASEDAQRVLARAVQAQAAGELTVVQIREIASELGIPVAAVDGALSEYRVTGAAELARRAAAVPTSPKKVDWGVVGIALMPALALSIAIALFGDMFGLSESVVERVSQIVFFPIFLGTYQVAKRRRSVTRA